MTFYKNDNDRFEEADFVKQALVNHLRREIERVEADFASEKAQHATTKANLVAEKGSMERVEAELASEKAEHAATKAKLVAEKAKVEIQKASKIVDDNDDFSVEVVLREIDPSEMTADQCAAGNILTTTEYVDDGKGPDGLFHIAMSPKTKALSEVRTPVHTSDEYFSVEVVLREIDPSAPAESTAPAEGTSPAESTAPAESSSPAQGTTPAESTSPTQGTSPAESTSLAKEASPPPLTETEWPCISQSVREAQPTPSFKGKTCKSSSSSRTKDSVPDHFRSKLILHNRILREHSKELGTLEESKKFISPHEHDIEQKKKNIAHKLKNGVTLTKEEDEFNQVTHTRWTPYVKTHKSKGKGASKTPDKPQQAACDAPDAPPSPPAIISPTRRAFGDIDPNDIPSPVSRRARRKMAHVNYAEPRVNRKMRRDA